MISKEKWKERVSNFNMFYAYAYFSGGFFCLCLIGYRNLKVIYVYKLEKLLLAKTLEL